MDKTELDKRGKSLTSLHGENTILKKALEQMHIQVFIYNVITKKLYFFKSNLQLALGIEKEMECTVSDILKENNIEAEYHATFLALFESIDLGEASAKARIRLNREGTNYWSYIVLENCYDKEGNPMRAIGTIQDVNSRVETELRYDREKQYRLAMLADYRRVYEINVTKDRFVRLKSIQDSTDDDIWQPYTSTMNYLLETKVFRADWDKFLKVANRDNLLRGFRNGITEFYCEYRMVDEDGNIRWSSSATHLLKEPSSDDIKGYIYTKDIDTQKKWELELAQQAERDSLTGIYNRRTGERLITQILNGVLEDEIYGFFIIDFDDFKYVNDNFGHIKGDQLLQEMTQKVNMIVKDSDVFARLGGDEFIIFLEEDDKKQRLERIAGLICNTIHDISIKEGNPYRPSVSIGIARYPECGSTFGTLYEASDRALYHVKQHGKNNAEFYIHTKDLG